MDRNRQHTERPVRRLCRDLTCCWAPPKSVMAAAPPRVPLAAIVPTSVEWRRRPDGSHHAAQSGCLTTSAGPPSRVVDLAGEGRVRRTPDRAACTRPSHAIGSRALLFVFSRGRSSGRAKPAAVDRGRPRRTVAKRYVHASARGAAGLAASQPAARRHRPDGGRVAAVAHHPDGRLSGRRLPRSTSGCISSNGSPVARRGPG